MSRYLSTVLQFVLYTTLLVFGFSHFAFAFSFGTQIDSSVMPALGSVNSPYCIGFGIQSAGYVPDSSSVSSIFQNCSSYSTASPGSFDYTTDSFPYYSGGTTLLAESEAKSLSTGFYTFVWGVGDPLTNFASTSLPLYYSSYFYNSVSSSVSYYSSSTTSSSTSILTVSPAQGDTVTLSGGVSSTTDITSASFTAFAGGRAGGEQNGEYFTMSTNAIMGEVSSYVDSCLTTAYLYNSGGTLLGTASNSSGLADFTSQNISLVSGDTYYVLLGSASNSCDIDIDSSVSYPIVRANLSFEGEAVYQGGSFPSYSGTSYIADIYSISTLVSSATSLTLSVTGYVVPSDFQSGMYVQYAFGLKNPNEGLTALDAVDGYSTTIVFPLTSSGDFSFSTTSANGGDGQYYSDVSIVDPPTFFGLFSGSTLTSTSTSWLLGTSSSADIFASSSQASLLALADALTGDLFNSSSSPCAIAQFNLFSCAYGILVPSPSVLVADFNTFYNGVLSVVPFGYVSHTVSLLSGVTASVEPPALTYTFGSSSPAVLQGGTVSFQIYDHFDVLNGVQADDGSHKNLWQIVDPFFSFLVGLCVLLVILDDLLGFNFNAIFASDKIGKNDNVGRKRDSRTLYEKSTMSDVNAGLKNKK